MFFSYFFLILAILCAFWGIVSSMAIANYVAKHGVKVKWILLNIMILNYINHYKILTEEEKGKPGLWYYSFIISMKTDIVAGLTGIIFIVV